MIKSIFELTPEDMRGDELWVMPMDETVDDDMSVRAAGNQVVPDGLMALFRCSFVDARGRDFVGYAFRDQQVNVEVIRPVVWVGGVAFNFWNGIVTPSAEYMAEVAEAFPPDCWPIRLTSNSRHVDVMTYALRGIYYIEGDYDIMCVCPGSAPTRVGRVQVSEN
jgi:hypothetical protein